MRLKFHQIELLKEGKFYRGDLKMVSQEYNLPYNRVIRVMNGTCFDNNIVNILYEKAMNNKYALECQMEAGSLTFS